MNDNVLGSSLDYSRISAYIPEVFNALYNQQAFESTSLGEMRDAFRVKQLQGKTWLLNAVEKYCTDKNARVLVIGSWFGFTSFCLWKLGFTNITEVDPDARLEPFAKHLNRFNKNFMHITADINEVNTADYDVIINPSGEHISDNSWFSRISNNSLVFIHSTNYPSDDHVNVCQNVEEMIAKYEMDCLYTGTLDLQSYKRFMLVGTKK
jgi:hypothetical protein